MNTNKLIPGVSTHFCCIGEHPSWRLTPGKIYKILEWRDYFYLFLDDRGQKRSRWFRYDVEDASYKGNLKKILE